MRIIPGIEEEADSVRYFPTPASWSTGLVADQVVRTLYTSEVEEHPVSYVNVFNKELCAQYRFEGLWGDDARAKLVTMH